MSSYEQLYLSGTRERSAELSRSSLSRTRLQDISPPAVSLSASTAAQVAGNRIGTSRTESIPLHSKNVVQPGPQVVQKPGMDERVDHGDGNIRERRSKGSSRQAIDENEWRAIQTRLGRQASPSTPLTLTEAFRINPSSFDGEKLRLVSGRITTITALPRSPLNLTPQVLVLFLSNNDISSLRGIECFVNTHTLSLTNNLIRYIEDLDGLSGLKELRKLSLLGNPVTDMPHYRARVLRLCTHIVSLDGAAVTAEERSSASATCRKADLALGMLSTNELKAVVLTHLAGLTRCHRELKSTVLGPFRSVRGDHIGSGAPDSSGSLGSVLQRCMFGGVFRWLEVSSSAYFKRRTEDICLRLSIIILNKSSPSHRPSTVAEVAQHWDGVFAEYLKRQQLAALQLVDSTTPGPGEASDRVLEALEELALEEGATDLGHRGPGQNFCGIGHHSEIRVTESSLKKVHSGNVSSSLEVPRAKSKVVAMELQRPVMVDDLYLPRPPPKQTKQGEVGNSVSLDDIHDAVRIKYNQLLRNLDSEQNITTAGMKAPANYTPIAVRLPPQQEEPRDVVRSNNGDRVQMSLAPHAARINGAESVIKDARESVVKAPINLAKDVSISQPLPPSTDAGGLPLESSSDLLEDDELAAGVLDKFQWLNQAEEFSWPPLSRDMEADDAFIGTMPKELVRGSAVANMRDARRLFEALQRDVEARQQEIARMVRINAKLRTDAEGAHAAAEAAAADAAKRLGEIYSARDLLRSDERRLQALVHAAPEGVTKLEVTGALHLLPPMTFIESSGATRQTQGRSKVNERAKSFH